MTTPTIPIEIPDVTRTCQDTPEVPDFTVAALVAALEAAWAAIRSNHPEVPAAVLVVGSGSPAKASQSLKFGHFAALRWQAGNNRLPEVLVCGEGLRRSPTEVFTTLLHEATHGLAFTRGVKDTSRQGRWHNKTFATLAAELGLSATKDQRLGYSPCTLTDATTETYAPMIDRLGHALGGYRRPDEFGPGKDRTNNNNGITAECACPRKIRLSVSALDAGPIGCDLCTSWFLPEDTDRDTYTHEHPYPTAGTGGPRLDDDRDDTDDDINDDDLEGDDMVFYDPTGARYGMPTYPYRLAPTGLATTRQLRSRGLRPGGQPICAQILWRRGKRTAYLYRIDLALPKRTATPAQLGALARAMTARQTCPSCADVKPYVISIRHGECLDCQPGGTP